MTKSLLLRLLFGLAPSLTAMAGTTSLSDPSVRFSVPDQHYVLMQRGEIEAIVADNHAINDVHLPRHRAGYSGLASLKHTHRPRNLFVDHYAGLNFEHIHDGRTLDRKILFEPRKAPMQLRQVDQHTTELYQAPTPHWQLESCHRYALLPDGVIELTIEWVPRAETFMNGYVGLFWACYIAQPQSGDIFFRGLRDSRAGKPDWVRGVSLRHGGNATHRHVGDDRAFRHDANFPLELVFNESPHRFTENWYYGVSHQMAWIMMFRPDDFVRFTQSPSGGGTGNPAWDFQALVSPYEVGRMYRMVIRAMYVPFESSEQLERVSRPHRAALENQE
jgi:hypothetical protein